MLSLPCHWLCKPMAYNGRIDLGAILDGVYIIAIYASNELKELWSMYNYLVSKYYLFTLRGIASVRIYMVSYHDYTVNLL